MYGNGHPFPQPAVKSVEAQFGPAFPEGAEPFVVIQSLPEPIARMADQFKQQELDAEMKAAEALADKKVWGEGCGG